MISLSIIFYVLCSLNILEIDDRHWSFEIDINMSDKL